MRILFLLFIVLSARAEQVAEPDRSVTADVRSQNISLKIVDACLAENIDSNDDDLNRCTHGAIYSHQVIENERSRIKKMSPQERRKLTLVMCIPMGDGWACKLNVLETYPTYRQCQNMCGRFKPIE